MDDTKIGGRRHAVVAEYHAERERLRELLGAVRERPDEPPAVAAEITARLASLEDEYCRVLPVVRMSRCPFTGEVVRHSLDVDGLDGPWWDHGATVRPEERLPPTYLALCGALRIGPSPESAPFVCCPGPGDPYVLPEFLGMDEVSAVLSSIRVGAHRAYPVFYFADPVPVRLPRVNTWACDHYTFMDNDGRLWRGRREPRVDDAEFDLAPWIRAGKLLWIAPDDQTLTLRSDVRACPYLVPDGPRAFQRIYRGHVWTDEAPVDAASAREAEAPAP